MNVRVEQLPRGRGWDASQIGEFAELKKSRLPIVTAFSFAVLIHVAALALLVTQVSKRELTMDASAPVTSVRVSLVAMPPPPPVVVPPPVVEAPVAPEPAVLTSESATRTIEQAPPKPVIKPEPKKTQPVAEQRPVEPSPRTETKPDPNSTQAQAAPVAQKLMDLPSAVPKDVPSVGCRVPAPEYPRRARRLHAQGQVLVRLEINPKGLVQRADVVRSSGNEDLDESAVTAVRGAVCNPYIEGGQAISVRAVQTVDFNLSK
ncbi:TonB family protein [Pseudomonas palleroniana]|uniref:energy transducer TonB n=1 Tax=Pseudomonas palleroniana TaxID=191390 RepID=UPI003B002A16